MGTDDITNVKKKSIVMKFYRAERWCWLHHLKILSIIIWRVMYILFACYIPPTTILMEGVNIAHGIGIVIHQESIIGKGTKIYQNVTIGSGHGPTIGENCILGCGCCILGDITLGDNVKVGANAVILEDIPSNCTVVGIPGKIVNQTKGD